MFSHYWNSCVGKTLISLANMGGVLPPYAVYGGSITDPEITEAWAGLSKLKPGIYILADKGWVDYTKCLIDHGIFLITPDKKRVGEDGFTGDDSIWNQDVAHLRIHVERCIRRIREFKVLNTRCPLSRKDLMSSIVNVCALLINFKAPIGGRDMGLVQVDPNTGRETRVSAYTLMWAPSVLSWEVHTPATAPHRAPGD